MQQNYLKHPGLRIFICILLDSFFIANAEIILDAGVVSYDPKSGIIVADGDVRVVQNLENHKTRELYAETVKYNRKTGQIKLIGEAIMKEPNGDIFSARNMSLEKGFKDAIAEALVVVLKDFSKIKSEKGEKKSNLYVFENVSYTPCKETACSAPLWDLVAEKTTYDRAEKKFVHKNVKLRIKGKPILFSPYFEHPSFDVKRKTGFLTPIFRKSSDIGFLAGFPFYIAISPDKSLKITPFINSRRRAFASTEYKQLFPNADFLLSASFLEKGKNKLPKKSSVEVSKMTEAEKAKEEAKRRDKRTRWHIDTIIKSHELDNKRITLRFNRSSDMTYKAKYPVEHIRGHEDFMKKKYNDSGIIMDFYDKNYFLTTDMHMYQTEDKATAPMICPHINFNTRKEAFYGEISFDSDTLCLGRNEKKSAMLAERFFRSSNTLRWQKSTNFAPFLLDVNSAFRADTFNASKTESAKSVQRTFPVFENQVALSLPYTSKLRLNGNTSIWAPKVSFTSVQTSTKRIKIKQREDSVFDNFSDLNLYAINRFGGYDSIERGERVSAGFENSIYNSKRRWLNFYVGRSFAISQDNDEQFKGRDKFVGRFVVKPIETLSFRMRFVGMPIFENSRQFEMGVNGGYGKISAGASYLYDRKISYVEERGVSQLGLHCGYKINEFWKISGTQILNLLPHGGKHTLAHSIFANYTDECFALDIGLYRRNFKYKDIKPHTGIILTIHFKNLGNFIHSGKRNLYNEGIGTVE